MKRLDYYWYSFNFISILLLPVSALYCLLSSVRRLLYTTGVLPSYKAPLPVIVIGNITVGGTGKTPVIIELVKILQSQGKKPGVISRGYAGKAQSWPQIVNESSNADLVGDEPQLIFQSTQCPVVVGPDRRQDIELLNKQFDCDVILSDDGLQHYKMKRDIEVAVVDAVRMFGNGLCIPSGPLRERPSRLKQVDMVLYNGGDENDIAFSLQPGRCQSVGRDNMTAVELDSFSGKTVHAVAGIGNPERFFNLLEKYGIKVIKHVFADHADYNKQDLCFDDEYPVLMTEKDAIKCFKFDLANHWFVPVQVKFTSSAQTALQKIFNIIN
ncbi:MAG: tetraacyldisaccharide 4'-kinase [Gammaproteobacteria bacterium]|nr:tetraacyldisaccharide 4'-kinase [Gammaproteobacteria bacterium]